MEKTGLSMILVGFFNNLADSLEELDKQKNSGSWEIKSADTIASNRSIPEYVKWRPRLV